MKLFLIAAILLAAYSGSIFSAAEAAPAKMSAKSAKSKKKSNATTSPAAAEKQLKAMGISKAQYDKELTNAIQTYDDFKKLRLLVAAGADITTPRTWDKLAELAQPGDSPQAAEALRQEMPPLTAALLISNERAARLLLKSPGISIKNWSPLEQAICNGKAEQVTELLNEGANPFVRGDSGTLPICLAAILGKKACIEAILSHKDCKDLAAQANKNAKELRSRLEIRTAYNLEKGAEDHQHKYGHFITDAFFNGSVAEFTLSLLYPQRDWQAPSVSNETISTWRDLFNEVSQADFVTYQERIKCKMMLKISKPDLPEAYIAVLNNDLKALQDSLANTPLQTLNGEPFNLEPILFYVIKTGNIKALKILLKAGVSPNQHTQRVTNGVIENMLMIAGGYNLGMFKELVDAGADINDAADHGRTFLDCAICSDDLQEYVNYIIKHPDFSDKSAKPLTIAILRKNYAKIQQLVDKGDITPYDILPFIPYCIRANEIKAIKIMAPVLYGTELQKRAINDAREQKRDDIVKILQGDK